MHISPRRPRSSSGLPETRRCSRPPLLSGNTDLKVLDPLLTPGGRAARGQAATTTFSPCLTLSTFWPGLSNKRPAALPILRQTADRRSTNCYCPALLGNDR
jgi:hypothetical protein